LGKNKVHTITNLQKLKGVCNASPLGENMKEKYYILTEDFEITLIFKKNKDGVLKLDENKTLKGFKNDIKELKNNLEHLTNSVVK
jgi:hypothetical protein